MPATYISKKLPSGNKAFCILARSNDVGIFRDESSGAFTVVRPSHPDSRDEGRKEGRRGNGVRLTEVWKQFLNTN
ncbi:hypothetical protein ALC57_07062 [Trachymyrmex cornetzi]|uniref:Uncharacterized protein n=1 Tax=Trachymyrmex cornetzi TaxID=471704 RepID=A0A195E5Y0_9HYME|nr:hypothetical protein ALC57_07062 [Trachymyrmex cornetzi]